MAWTGDGFGGGGFAAWGEVPWGAIEPAHASVHAAWPSPLLTARGRSVPAYHAGIRGVLDVHIGLVIDAGTEPPTFDLSDEAFLLLADQLLNG